MSQHPAQSQNYRHFDEPRPEEIETALNGAEFPMGREKVLALALSNGANGAVMAVLERMNNHHFDSTDSVLREVSGVE